MENVYVAQGVAVVWPVMVPCPHSEVAFTAEAQWCETCGKVL